MQKILFRVDSSSTIGTGHLMRDLVLATQYKNANISFATQNLDGNLNSKILKAGYTLHTLKSNDTKELTQLIQKLKIDLLIIDHYKIGYKEEKYIKDKTAVKILAFDDSYEKHYCDTLLNHNISANKKKYKKLVPSHCKLNCGAKYTLLREEFYQEKQKRYRPNKQKTFFVAMGGADTAELNIPIIKTLKKLKNIQLHLLTTQANKNLSKLKKYVQSKKWIKLHVDSTRVAKYIKKSDCAIITPSVVANEVFFMQKPFIAIKTADNQLDMYNYLKKSRYKTLKKFSSKKLLALCEELL